jgi:hypothetical protein
MGICISYKGSLSDPRMLDKALDEVRGFCRRAGWPCEDFSEHYSGVALTTQAEADDDPGAKPKHPPEPWPETKEKYGLRARVSKLYPPGLIEETVRGVMVSPTDTDSLRLVFDKNGRLVNYMELPVDIVINAIPDTAHYIAFPHFLKTQGAPASHAALCLLLRMLKQKFMKNLIVKDPTRFWATGNFARLEREHAELGAIIGLFRTSKNLGGLLRAMGVDIPGSKVEQLDPNLKIPVAKKKTKKKSALN